MLEEMLDWFAPALMASTKSNKFLQDDWLSLVFFSWLPFIASKLSFGIENYELCFLLYEIIMNATHPVSKINL